MDDHLSRNEILSILGSYSDPKHSLSWYKDNYSNLGKILKKQIMEDINMSGIFPSEAQRLTEKQRALRYYQLIIKNDDKYSVTNYDTDRGLIISTGIYSDIVNAIDVFIDKSFCAGGKIKDFI